MFLSLVDALRCPAAHEESPLVLSVEAWHGSRIVRGVLGCPVCRARYSIVDGVVDFTGGDVHTTARSGSPPADDALRLAAQLGLAEPGGLVLLTGRYASQSRHLLDLVDVTCLLADASDPSSAEGVLLRLAERLPLGGGALRGAAIDSPRAASEFLAEVVRCTRGRGRIVGPAGAPVPVGASLIARDDREWVAEVEAVVTTVPLRRGGLAP